MVMVGAFVHGDRLVRWRPLANEQGWSNSRRAPNLAFFFFRKKKEVIVGAGIPERRGYSSYVLGVGDLQPIIHRLCRANHFLDTAAQTSIPALHFPDSGRNQKPSTSHALT